MNHKKLVREGYNQAAEHYLGSRDQFKNQKYLELLAGRLKPGSRILDIGCGAGKPIDQYLIDHGHSVIGIDISEKQIELARKHVPQGKFEVKDMEELKTGEFKVDAVVSFYAIFHIAREKHGELFGKINSFLPAGGLVLVTMGSSDWEGTEEDFHGTQMYWSHYDNRKNREIVAGSGFDVLTDEIDATGGEKHQVILAKKKQAGKAE